MSRTRRLLAAVAFAASLAALAPSAWAQPELRSGAKGATVPSPVTSTSVDANTQALDVILKGATSTVIERQATVVTPIADVSITNAATSIVASDATRLLLTCVNTGAQNMRVGSSAVTATTGMQVRPGGSFSTTATAAIQAISETATATTASCTRENQ
jgi:hypothetical protein